MILKKIVRSLSRILVTCSNKMCILFVCAVLINFVVRTIA